MNTQNPIPTVPAIPLQNEKSNSNVILTITGAIILCIIIFCCFLSIYNGFDMNKVVSESTPFVIFSLFVVIIVGGIIHSIYYPEMYYGPYHAYNPMYGYQPFEHPRYGPHGFRY